MTGSEALASLLFSNIGVSGHRSLVIQATKGQPWPMIGVQMHMRERTASHRQHDTSPEWVPAGAPARHSFPLHSFPRILALATMALTLAMPGCHGSSAAQASTQSGDQSTPAGDPSDVNAAEAQPACPTGQVLMSDGSCAAGSDQPAQPAAGTPAPAQAPESSSTPPASAPQSAPPQHAQNDAQYPPPQQYPQDQQDQDQQQDQSGDSGVYDTQNPYDDQTYQQDAYNDGYQQGYEQGIEASQPPPELPIYEQPLCPGPGYMWNPGYWYWGPQGYYWVPGVWVFAPYTGALWTPGWWGFFGSRYRWHHGYWGSHVGFYGGVPYGYGYTGSGYHGGYWNRDRFMYNRSVNNINTTNITNVYNRTVVVNHVNRISYNGGRGGLNVRPSQSEFNAMRERHVRALPTQVQHRTQAMQNRQQYATVNRGKPVTAVAAHPLPVRHVNVAPAVVNPGVHGATRPAPAVARPQPGARPGQPGARPGAPGATPQPNQPGRPNTPGAPPNRVQPTHTQPIRPNQPGQPSQPAPGQPANRTPTNPQGPGARPQPSHTPPMRPETRPAPQPSHPAPQPRPETRPQPQPARPAPQPRPEMRPTPQPARPAPQPRPEMRPAPQPARPAPQPRPEMRPQPQHTQPQPQRQAPHENPHQDQPHG
jgi:hypothetical protein